MIHSIPKFLSRSRWQTTISRCESDNQLSFLPTWMASNLQWRKCGEQMSAMESKAGRSQTQFQACVERFCSADQLPAKLTLATPYKFNLHTYMHMGKTHTYILRVVAGSFEVKLPTLWRDGKAEVGKVREEKRKSERKQDAQARKGSKVAAHWGFQWFAALLKRRVWEIKKISHCRSAKPISKSKWFEMHKEHYSRNTFGSWCRKSARRRGVKQISKSKCTKHSMVGPLLEVEMSKKCKSLWREAHIQVKSAKNDGYGKNQMSKSARRCGAKHMSTSERTKHTTRSFHCNMILCYEKFMRIWRKKVQLVYFCSILK